MLGGVQPRNKRFAWKTCGKPLAPLDYLPMRWYPLGGILQQKKNMIRHSDIRVVGQAPLLYWHFPPKTSVTPACGCADAHVVSRLCVLRSSKNGWAKPRHVLCTVVRVVLNAGCPGDQRKSKNETTNKRHAYHHRFKLIKAFRAAFSHRLIWTLRYDRIGLSNLISWVHVQARSCFAIPKRVLSYDSNLWLVLNFRYPLNIRVFPNHRF